jgi:hypothetical protein
MEIVTRTEQWVCEQREFNSVSSQHPSPFLDASLHGLPTPPSSQQDMSTSPKRPRADDFGSPGADVDRTPTSHTSYRLPKPPSLPPPSSSTSSSQRSRNSSTSRRAPSPTKRTQNLRALQTPVDFIALSDKPKTQLPIDALRLHDQVYSITIERDAFLPRHARHLICSALDREIKETWFLEEDRHKNEEHTVSAVRAEFEALQKIQSAAQTSLSLGRSEAAWNLEVHGPLLDLSLSGNGAIAKEYIPTAQIAPAFVPPTAGASLVTSKMVDFGIVLVPDQQSSLYELLRTTVLSEPGGSQCINQTLYPPVQYHPISISVETKASASAEEGRVQLGVWTAAWYQRMKAFRTSRSESLQAEERMLTLPLLLVVEHEWKLFFACDRGDRLEIVGDMSIGDTKSLIGLYTVVAVLRVLAKWTRNDFKDWISRFLQSCE